MDGSTRVAMSNRRKPKSSAVVTPEINPQQENQPRGFRVPEAARYIGSTICFIRQAIKDREIPALMLGKRHVLLKEDLDNFLDAQRRRA
jgi:excisionase family DNA binding protein